MVVPTPYLLGHKVPTPGPRDPRGNRTIVWEERPDVACHWAAPGQMADTVGGWRESSTIEWTVCVPSPCPIRSTDRVVWDGVEYAVDGVPQDWTFGLWPNPAAAVLVQLTKVTG